jgi:hypothetical protein
MVLRQTKTNNDVHRFKKNLKQEIYSMYFLRLQIFITFDFLC